MCDAVVLQQVVDDLWQQGVARWRQWRHRRASSQVHVVELVDARQSVGELDHDASRHRLVPLLRSSTPASQPLGHVQSRRYYVH